MPRRKWAPISAAHGRVTISSGRFRGAEAASGRLAVDLDGVTIGIVSLERRDAEYEVRPAFGNAELGYLFLAAEALAAALCWFADAWVRRRTGWCPGRRPER